MVRVLPLALQMVVQHRKAYLVALLPCSTRVELKQREYCPPAYPVTLTTNELRLLIAKLGSPQIQLTQNLTKRQLVRLQFLQYPSAVWSQSQVLTPSCVQYQLEMQLLGSSMTQPFWQPQFKYCPYVLKMDLYQPVYQSRASVMQEMVGLFISTPAVMNSLQTALYDQCDIEVPWPPPDQSSMPGQVLQPYWSLSAFCIQLPLIQELWLTMTSFPFTKLLYNILLNPSICVHSCIPIFIFIWKDSASKEKQKMFQCSNPHSGCFVDIEYAHGQLQAVTPLSLSFFAYTKIPQSDFVTGVFIRLCGTMKLRHCTQDGSIPWATLKLRLLAQQTSMVLCQNNCRMFIILTIFWPREVVVSTSVVLQSVQKRMGPYSEVCSLRPGQVSLMGMSFWLRMIWSWMQPGWAVAAMSNMRIQGSIFKYQQRVMNQLEGEGGINQQQDGWVDWAG